MAHPTPVLPCESGDKAVLFREARPDDTEGIVRLVNSVFGHDRTVDWFEHLHRRNPAGPSILLVAVDAGGEVVSFRSVIRQKAHFQGAALRCGQLADTATDPRYRRLGLATRLNIMALGRFFAGGGDLVFSFPGPMSYPLYTGRLGFTDVGRLTQVILPLADPGRGLASLRAVFKIYGRAAELARVGARAAASVTVSPVEVGSATALVRSPDSGLLSFDRGPDILSWRTSIPARPYHTVALDQQNYLLVGEAERRSLRVCTILETRARSARDLRTLLMAAASWASGRGFAGLYTWLPRAGRGVYLSCGFVPTLRTTRLVARFKSGSVGDGASSRAPRELSRIVRWHLTLLDTDSY